MTLAIQKTDPPAQRVQTVGRTPTTVQRIAMPSGVGSSKSVPNNWFELVTVQDFVTLFQAVMNLNGFTVEMRASRDLQGTLDGYISIQGPDNAVRAVPGNVVAKRTTSNIVEVYANMAAYLVSNNAS